MSIFLSVFSDINGQGMLSLKSFPFILVVPIINLAWIYYIGAGFCTTEGSCRWNQSSRVGFTYFNCHWKSGFSLTTLVSFFQWSLQFGGSLTESQSLEKVKQTRNSSSFCHLTITLRSNWDKKLGTSSFSTRFSWMSLEKKNWGVSWLFCCMWLVCPLHSNDTTRLRLSSTEGSDAVIFSLGCYTRAQWSSIFSLPFLAMIRIKLDDSGAVRLLHHQLILLKKSSRGLSSLWKVLQKFHWNIWCIGFGWLYFLSPFLGLLPILELSFILTPDYEGHTHLFDVHLKYEFMVPAVGDLFFSYIMM